LEVIVIVGLVANELEGDGDLFEIPCNTRGDGKSSEVQHMSMDFIGL